MGDRLRIGVAGAGSIGCYVGGRLIARDAAEVVFVGRPRLRDELTTHGMTLQDLERASVVAPASRVRFETEIDALAPCDVVLCCVKSAQTADVARQLADVLRADAVIASLQNGIRNADVLREHLGARTVLAGIVSFNVVSRGDGVFHRATTGPIMLERSDAPHASALVDALIAADIPTETRADLAPDQWTKLLVNLNNAVSALSGAPTQEILLTPGYRRVLAALMGEALEVLRAAGVRPARLRGMPVHLLPRALRLPTPLVRLIARAQMKVDPGARSSMWEDLTRGRPTEVDYLNGEIVRLAERSSVLAPLNRRIVELVHEAEAAGPGSPGLGAAELWSRLHAS